MPGSTRNKTGTKPSVGGAGLPYPDAGTALGATFEVLRELTGLPAWYLVAGHGMPAVLYVDDPVFGLNVGDVWPWPELVDMRTISDTDRVVRHADSHHAAGPAVVTALTVRDAGGAPYAVLCGASAQPLRALPRRGEPARQLMLVLRHHARVIASLLEADGRAARAEAGALLDPLTRLANLRAWQRLLEREEARCRQSDHPVGVLVVDIDGLTAVNRTEGHAAGDDLLVRAAMVLLRSSRGADVVARLAGDRFAILASGATEGQLAALGTRLRLRLAGTGVPASVGWSSRRGHRDLEETWVSADRDMLRAKQSLGRRRAAPPLP
jgi:diguanylate cyclase (GGDEF)-like protein